MPVLLRTWPIARGIVVEPLDGTLVIAAFSWTRYVAPRWNDAPTSIFTRRPPESLLNFACVVMSVHACGVPGGLLAEAPAPSRP